MRRVAEEGGGGGLDCLGALPTVGARARGRAVAVERIVFGHD